MFPTTLITATLALLASVQAIKVNSPSTSTVQSAGDALQVTWESVSTDPTSFAIVLVNQNSAFLPTSPTVLTNNQSTSAGSASLQFPNGAWPAGTGFQVNLVKSTDELNSILAQSGMFNITASASSSSSSASSASSAASSSRTSSSAASSSAAATPVQSGASAIYSGNAASSAAIPSGSATSGAMPALDFRGLSGVLVVAGSALAVAAGLVGF